MSLLNNILSQVSDNATVQNLAAKVGMTPEQVEQAVAALGQAHASEGDTVTTAAAHASASRPPLIADSPRRTALISAFRLAAAGGWRRRRHPRKHQELHLSLGGRRATRRPSIRGWKKIRRGLPVPKEGSMRKLVFALTALSLLAGSAPALAAPCKDAKGKFVKKIAVSSSMGPGVKVDLTEIAGA